MQILRPPPQTSPQIYGIRNFGREVMRAREETAVSVVNSIQLWPTKDEKPLLQAEGIAGV